MRGLMVLAFVSCLPFAVSAEAFRTFDGHGGPVMGLSLSEGGETLLTTSFDNSVGLWAADGTAPPVWLEGHEAAVNTGVFLPGNRAATGGDDHLVLVWDLETSAVLHRLEGHQGKVMGLAASPDGMRLASAGWDGTIRI